MAGFTEQAVVVVAQGFGLGRIRVAPGTFGSLAGILWLMLLLRTGCFWLFLGGLLFGIFVSVWICGRAERILAMKDPSSVVLDEIVAVPIGFVPWVLSEYARQDRLPDYAVLMEGRMIWMTAVLFVLFRVFDILKPWPVGASQRMRGGWGVTMDDVLAGIYTALISLVFVL